MKKILLALLIVGVVAFAGPRPVFAQADAATVKIPFRFIVGDTLLPAGSYRITSDPRDPSLITIAALGGKPATFAVTQSAAGPGELDAKVQVAFKNIGGQYFLSQVAMPGSNSWEMVVTQAGAERTLAKLNLLPTQHADVAK